MNTSARVTVLMPVYNALPYLDQAISSILAQCFVNFELLVVNDGSDAPTTERIAYWAGRDGRIRVVHNVENLGITRALNIGLAAARGELLARQDADDIALPYRLQAQVAFLDHHPGHVLVGTNCLRIDSHGHPRILDSQGHQDWELELIALIRTPIVHSTAMFRLQALRGLGLHYDTDYPSAEDFDLWLRLSAVGRTAMLPEVLVYYREHAAAISTQRRDEQHRNMRRIALRHCFERLPQLESSRSAVTAFYDLFYLHQMPSPGGVRQAYEGIEALATAFASERRLTRAQRFRVRRLCARWLAMGLVRSHTFRRPAALTPLLGKAFSLLPPLAAEMVDLVIRRLRGRWSRWPRPNR